MNKRAAIFIDVDGTLFSHASKSIPKSALTSLKEAYHEFDLFLATGRSLCTLKIIEEALPYFKGKVLMNGAYVEFSNNILKNEYLKKEDVIRLTKICHENNIIVSLVTNEIAYVSKYNEVVEGALKGHFPNSIIYLDNSNFNFNINYNMGWIFAPSEEIDILATSNPNLSFVKWGNYGCDVIKPQMSKAIGILEIIKNGDYQNTYAIGDGNNDIEMLKLVKHGIAMGNATSALLKYADFITSPIDEEGLANAFKEIKKFSNN